jgi:hypothetical protein
MTAARNRKKGSNTSDAVPPFLGREPRRAERRPLRCHARVKEVRDAGRGVDQARD